jgi:hypothetical protein
MVMQLAPGVDVPERAMHQFGLGKLTPAQKPGPIR